MKITVREFRDNLKKYFDFSDTQVIEIERHGNVYTLNKLVCTQSKDEAMIPCTQTTTKEERLSVARETLKSLMGKENIKEVVRVELKCYQCKSKDIYIRKAIKGKEYGLCKDCYEVEVLV